MNNKDGAVAVENMMKKYGCLPTIGSGPTLENFHPLELAQALEQELNRSAQLGFTKITIHMDLPDAAALARALRKE